VREYPVGAIASLFAEFYREAMVRIGAAPFYHFPDAYFRALEAMRGIHLFVCERDGVWMSAGLFLSGGDCLEYHLSATTTEGRALSATNLLIDYAAESGKQTGHHWLYLGGGTDASASNPLLRFKEGFSPLRRLYSYGYAVHDAAFYRELQMGYPESSRVLFYR
jgi:lipid II:glycine glycyltransferase (peptidoglycan interpeptide bridge formation enzyme)